jgi:hypothetical protein
MPDEKPDPATLASDGDDVLEGVDPPTYEEWIAFSKEHSGDR